MTTTPLRLRPSLLGSILVLCALALPAAAGPQRPAPGMEEMVRMLQVLDERSRNYGDYRAHVIAQVKKEDTVTVREILLFRRDKEEKLMLLLSAPKSEQGKGYLREDANLWSYDPNVGRWERRTDREAIGGTDSRRTDFDKTEFAREYDPTFTGWESLGRFETARLTLRQKKGLDLAFPVLHLWIDRDSGNVLKRQELALSGRLMRTVLYPKWKKVYSDSKQGDFWYSEEIHVFDELQKGNSTVLAIKTVDLRPLEANMFTKAWLESKSR